MHNLKDLRKNLETFKKKFKDRNLDFNIDEFDKADKINRELINKKELLEQEKKQLYVIIRPENYHHLPTHFFLYNTLVMKEKDKKKKKNKKKKMKEDV